MEHDSIREQPPDKTSCFSNTAALRWEKFIELGSGYNFFESNHRENKEEEDEVKM